MDNHIKRLCGVSVAQLRHIADVRHCLTQDAAEKLVHAFITSRLDYCNALFLGVSAGSLQKLQRLQNMAARVLTRTRRCQHITPVLHQLHWLPVQYRVQYKTMLLTGTPVPNRPPAGCHGRTHPALLESEQSASAPHQAKDIRRPGVLGSGPKAMECPATKTERI
jgi:hypothetical protein